MKERGKKRTTLCGTNGSQKGTSIHTAKQMSCQNPLSPVDGCIVWLGILYTYEFFYGAPKMLLAFFLHHPRALGFLQSNDVHVGCWVRAVLGRAPVATLGCRWTW